MPSTNGTDLKALTLCHMSKSHMTDQDIHLVDQDISM